MKRLAVLSVGILVALTGITGAWALTRHIAQSASIYCGGAKASFVSFPPGTHLVTVKALRNGLSALNTTRSFTGTAGDVSVPLDTSVEADWAVTFSWSDDGGGSKTVAAHVLCSSTTTTVTTPGQTTTTTVTTPAPPPVTVTTPAPPAVTVTTPAPPAVTVTTTVQSPPRAAPKPVVKTVVKWRTKTVVKVKKVKVKCVGKPKQIPYTP